MTWIKHWYCMQTDIRIGVNNPPILFKAHSPLVSMAFITHQFTIKSLPIHCVVYIIQVPTRCLSIHWEDCSLRHYWVTLCRSENPTQVGCWISMINTRRQLSSPRQLSMCLSNTLLNGVVALTTLRYGNDSHSPPSEKSKLLTRYCTSRYISSG